MRDRESNLQVVRAETDLACICLWKVIDSISSLKRVISFVALKSPTGGMAVITLTLGQRVCIQRAAGSRSEAEVLLTS